MDAAIMKLPLRLLPRKGGAIVLCLFFLFIFGFAVVWTAMATVAVLGGDMVDGFGYAFPAFGVPFLVIGFCGLGFAVTRLLPDSPYYHVQISSEGLAVRRAWKIQQCSWQELSPFAVSARTRSTKNGRRTTHWVVALRAGDESRLAIDSERYARSVVQIDVGAYGSGDAARAAAVMADWLNAIRTLAVERPGRAIDTIAVPPEFRNRLVEFAPAAGATAISLAASAKRSSVIER